MNANDKVQVVIPGKGDLILQPQDHLATGGEGAVYLKNGMVFKLYLDPKAARARGMADKVALLAGLRHPYIVAPIDVLLDKRQDLIGYYMPAASGEAMMRVFTSAWRDANGFGDTKAVKLVENMRTAVEAAHGLGAVMADGNETNWLADGVEPRVIDVDSWQIGKFPATAIMASIFDYHRPPPSRESDWFAWGIVSFQVLTGIHPYKGSHPDFRRGDLEARMRANASVLDPKVRLNAAVRHFGVIPGRLRDWYEAVFQRAERLPPPSLRGSAVPDGAPRRARAVASAGGMLKHDRYLTLPGPARLVTRDGIGVLEVAGELQAHDIVRRQRITGVESADLARLLKQQAVLIRNASSYVWLELDGAAIRGRLVAGERDPVTAITELAPLPCIAERLLSLGGRVFALNGEQDLGMIELAINQLGARTFLSIRQAWPVRARASRFYDGFGLTDCLGVPFVVLPEGDEAVLIQRAVGLKGYRIIGGYAGGSQCIVVSAIRRSDGQLYRLLLHLVGQEFEVAEASVIDEPNLNIAVTERGIALEIADDGELTVWNTQGASARRVSDQAMTRELRLLALPGGVFYLAGKDVFRLTLT
jgi:hypothetical protein